MYEKTFIYFESGVEIDNSTPTDSTLSKQIVDAVNKTLEESSRSVYADNEVVDFDSSTDDNLYTVTPADAPTSSVQQQTIFLLEIRNILLIFLFSWFILTIYSKLKNLIINYFD